MTEHHPRGVIAIRAGELVGVYGPPPGRVLDPPLTGIAAGEADLNRMLRLA
jgi:hypothetical protein